MEQTNLYEAIFKRKSVRKYDMNPLGEKTLLEITGYINSVKSLFPEIKIETHIVGQHEVKLLLPIKAPHYLLFYSENKEGYLTNAGYMLQQVDLFLSINGIGSCYVGMAQPTKTATESSELEFVIVLAFGPATETVHRDDISKFKRKTLLQITDISNHDKLMETARLAPSATNSQPWFFTGGNGIIHAYCVKPNFIKAIIYKKMNKIDMGIALCHLAVAAERDGKKIIFVHNEAAQDNAPKGYYYITTANLTT